MAAFTELELAALNSIFSETPKLQAQLERQLAAATVTGRKNSGVGFFTAIAVASAAPDLSCPRVLGHQTQAHVAGLEHGLGFVLFTENGKLHQLEGYIFGEDETASLDLATLSFAVFKNPVLRQE